MVRYICVGCSEVHEDEDYSSSDGDILLTENVIKCLTNFINAEYDANLEMHPDARRSFELQQRILKKIKGNPCSQNKGKVNE